MMILTFEETISKTIAPFLKAIPVESGAAKLAAWRECVDVTLSEWARNPSRIKSEGIEPPTQAAIKLAGILAADLRDAGCSGPTYIVPNNEGGVVFEWHGDSTTALLEIEKSETVAVSVLTNHRVTFSQKFAAE